MKWERMLFTIVLNIFLMIAVSIVMEYSDLTERFVSVEDSIQEALDMSIEASVHSEEFFSERYQSGMLMSYAGVESGSSDMTSEATTLVWVRNANKFAQVNTYQFAEWFATNHKLPDTMAEVGEIGTIGTSASDVYGLVGHVYEWLYGKAGSDYVTPSLAYANKNSARRAEYTSDSVPTTRAPNPDFRQYYNNVGSQQQTVGYLKTQDGSDSYRLNVYTYPTLANMGLVLHEYNKNSSLITADNLCSTLHIGKSRVGAQHTYYFLTPASLGVTYVPLEVLKPVFVANLDTIVRLNKLGGNNGDADSAGAISILSSASNCIETSVWDCNAYTDGYASVDNRNNGLDGIQHAHHRASSLSEDIVTDGLVEFDLSTAQVKVDYFYVDFSSDSADNAVLMSKLNGTLTSDGAGGVTGIDALRQATLDAFQEQDSGENVTNFGSGDFGSNYASVKDGRIVARVSVKMKIHVPYKSPILQWVCYRFTGTNHYDIKRYDPSTGSAFTTLADSDGLWYQYTTYFCTSRS